MNEGNKKNTEKLCGVLMKNEEKSAKQPSKVIDAAKTLVRSKEISLELFHKQITAWSKISADVPESYTYKDLIEDSRSIRM